MKKYRTRALDATTWPDFARLAEANNGVWGGRVEGYPEDIEGRKASPAFLFNGALTTFERLGFERSRRIGKHKWVVSLTVR